MQVMYLDAWLSMVIFTVATVAFYVLGAAVLHPQGLDPQGADMIRTLSAMYVRPLGAWTRDVFLIGAWAGGLKIGEAYYYRIQGPTFLMESANVQNNANHIHAAWRISPATSAATFSANI